MGPEETTTRRNVYLTTAYSQALGINTGMDGVEPR